ncbi:hypothetical protein [Komagataeibacter xylinus]|uniref:Uncharacterized protein n=1 Tax=Komagataeibacter xylinus TaxID=28448 RepID=A0A857FTM4_KOMXY|nr:hypothetical protein [Komagataeibacter xylinus]QHC36497.1 hypothetical protein FMA36_14190 [Komagataeibacter xylinus]
MPVTATTNPPRFMPFRVMARSCVLAVGMGLALPLMACSGRIGEDACISCSREKTDPPRHDPAAPTGNAVGEGMGGPTGSPQQAGQDQSPGAASAPGM